jgi:tRNA-Thr(GGU) m(6)t(6)A37 methyltransferase TsaA
MGDTEFAINPIGHVAVDDSGFHLIIEERYRPALRELDDFGHINVLWWCHLLDEPQYRSMTVSSTPYKDAPDEIGIFATRSPARPNPIALTTVMVSSIDHHAGVITVPYIDAENGTPIIDIKPYHPSVDRVRDIRLPDWCSNWPQWYEDSATFDWDAVFENAR